MEDERKYYFKLALILIFISLLLIFRFILEFILYYNDLETLILDFLALIWPLIGVSTAIEFLMGDKWGWGGILFHIFILYCGIYYLIVFIIFLFEFSIQIELILKLCLYLAITSLGWISFLLYYD